MYCQSCFTESPNTSLRCIQCRAEFFPEKKPNPQHEKKQDVWTRALVIAASACIGSYSGIYIVILVLPSLVIWWLCKKLLHDSAKIYVTTISMQTAQMFALVFLMVFYIAKGTFPYSVIGLVGDLIIPAAGVGWLILRPRLPALIYLTVYQVAMLAFNGFLIYQLQVGDMQHKAIAAHIVWRVMAVFYMWSPFFNSKAQLNQTNS